MPDSRDNYINSVNLNAETDFPYLVMEIINNQSFPRNPGFRVMHWHEDVQFLYVLDGEIAVRTLETRTPVEPGQAVFINKNVVHMIEHDAPCHYYSFVFPDVFLRFYTGSPASKLVDRVIENSSLPVYLFTQENSWCENVFSELKALIALEKIKKEHSWITTEKEKAKTAKKSDAEKNTAERAKGNDAGDEYYPYEVLTRLSSLWLTFGKNITLPDTKSADALNARMQMFLRYIEAHYAEEITLEQIAASASVSVSECTRCFKKTTAMTPYRYLMEYRLARASELLLKTDRAVSIIALDCGFRQTSHFGKLFREKTGCSPREYRSLNRA